MKNIKLSLPLILSISLVLNLCTMLISCIYLGIGVGLFIEGVILMIIVFLLIGQYVTIPPSIVFIVGTILLEFLISPLRGYMGMEVSSLLGFPVFLFFTHYLLKRYYPQVKPIVVTLYIAAALLLLELPVRAFNFERTLISLPDFFVHLLGIFAGYFFYERKKILHTINLSVSVLVVLFVYFYGYTLWLNKLEYGTFTGETHFKSPPAIVLKDGGNNFVPVKNGKLTVMDFWFLRCGACFEEFPEFQKLYKSYKNNPNIQFYSVNQPYPSDNGENSFKTLKDLGYTFPMAVADKNKTLINSLQVAVYPTIVVMDTDGFVVYKGDLKGAEATIRSYMHPDND